MGIESLDQKMTTKPWCSICGRILDDVDAWSKNRPTEPGQPFWILWPKMVGRSPQVTYAFYDWGTKLIYFVENRQLMHITPEDADGCQFCPVAPHPPLLKEG